MLRPDSRYKHARRFVSAPPDEGPPFPGLRPRVIAPAEGVIEHVLRAGDRLDHLARHYYNDDRLWWRILDANPHLLYGGVLFPLRADETDSSDENAPPAQGPPVSPGDVIVIPQARQP